MKTNQIRRSVSAVGCTLLCTAAILTATTAFAQESLRYARRETNNGTPIFQHHSSTYEEGVLNGWANLWRGGGDYQYNMSLAMINREVARQMAIDNDVRRVESYYQKKQARRESLAAEKSQRSNQPSPQPSVIERLGPRQFDAATGRIQWPALLDDQLYVDMRNEIDRLFAMRSPGQSGKDSPIYLLMREKIQGLNDLVRTRVHDMPSNDYVEVKRFIRRLSTEAQLPLETNPTTMAVSR